MGEKIYTQEEIQSRGLWSSVYLNSMKDCKRLLKTKYQKKVLIL